MVSLILEKDNSKNIDNNGQQVDRGHFNVRRRAHEKGDDHSRDERTADETRHMGRPGEYDRWGEWRIRTENEYSTITKYRVYVLWREGTVTLLHMSVKYTKSLQF